ncbi:MAG: nucleoid occlusion protein [Erysipelotrichaceae bacterium]
MKEVKTISIDQIEPNPFQPRVEFNGDALMDLAQSIRENGLIQPICVREKTKDNYEIVAGERRYRAMKLIGQIEVPVIVMDANELQMAEMALVENIQRENLSAIEEAKAYVEIMRCANLTQSSLALKVGKSQSSIANKLRLLNLDDNIQNAVRSKIISERHARALLSVEKQQQDEYLNKIIKKKLTVAETEKMIKKDLNPKDEHNKPLMRGVTRNVKIAINTIKQAITMVSRTGVLMDIKEDESEDDYTISIRFSK